MDAYTVGRSGAKAEVLDLLAPRHQAEAFCEVRLMAFEDTLADRDPEMARLRFENEILRHRCGKPLLKGHSQTRHD